ncbi:MAG: SEC-C domain-containing protein [Acidobacteria bacterium]|nr:SEC-C domain-containing protein [Acidobacteriota bacterium]
MAKPGRNDLCPCGSGRKYKKCCESKERSRASGRLMMILVGAAVLAAVLVGIASFTGERATGPTRVWSTEHGHYHDASGTAVP